MSRNFTVLGGSIGQTYVQNNCAQDPRFQALLSYFTSQGMTFNYSRSIAVVGLNNDPTPAGNQSVGNPYLLAVTPSFVPFDFSSTPSHNAASIVCFVSAGITSYIGALVNINHQPLENEVFTLVELDQNNNILTTVVKRGQILNNNVTGLAAQMGGTPYDPNVWSLLPDSVGVADTASLTSIIFNALVGDTYAAPLYETGGVYTMLQDATVPAMFSQAVAARATILAAGLTVGGLTIQGHCTSTSTSSNGCCSCSTSFTISSASSKS